MQDNETKEGGLLRRLQACEGGLTPRDRRNQRNFLGFMFAWALSFAATAFLLKNEWVTSLAASTALAATPTALGILVLLALLKFLKEADELTRRIQLEGLAIGFGAGTIFAMGYPMFEFAGWPELPDSTTAAILMAGWGIGSLFALRRYL